MTETPPLRVELKFKGDMYSKTYDLSVVRAANPGMISSADVNLLRDRIGFHFQGPNGESVLVYPVLTEKDSGARLLDRIGVLQRP